MKKKARDKIAHRLEMVRPVFGDEAIVKELLKRIAFLRTKHGNPLDLATVNNATAVLQMLLFRDVPAMLEALSEKATTGAGPAAGEGGEG